MRTVYKPSPSAQQMVEHGSQQPHFSNPQNSGRTGRPLHAAGMEGQLQEHAWLQKGACKLLSSHTWLLQTVADVGRCSAEQPRKDC